MDDEYGGIEYGGLPVWRAHAEARAETIRTCRSHDAPIMTDYVSTVPRPVA